VSRRAKIVCTLGPASHSDAEIRTLVEAGMDVARLNFSHGDHPQHAELCGKVRAVAEACGRAVGVLADLQGPRIRLGAFAGGRAQLESGAEFVLTTVPRLGDGRIASTSYEALARDVRPGDAILIDDGRLRLEVLASDGREVRCRVIEGGEVSDHKGLNLPGVRVSAPALTAKDLEDLRFALSLPVDLVALSFVRDPADAVAGRRAMAEAGVTVPLIAKLEKPEALDRLEEIVRAFDGLMVARGDLGVELPLERVPLVQKAAIRLARAHARPVIVATQMLDSMIIHSRPTRAEVSDVANAVLDGADALMLSGETSVGAHARESVAVMARVITAAEESGACAAPPPPGAGAAAGEAIAAAAVQAARDLGACALVAFTVSGDTARRLARHRPATPLLAFTTEPAVRRQLALVWGVEAFVMERAEDTDAMVRRVDRALLELGKGARGDRIVVVAGTPPGTVGSTNTVRVHRLGEG
jgi:pyruvate kinase